MNSYPVFRRAICTQNVRPPIPEMCPQSIRELMELCWHKDPEARPDFAKIITILNDIVVEVAVRDAVGAEFWRTHFAGKEFVPFDTFIHEFANAIDGSKPLSNEDLEMLKLLLGNIHDDGILAPELVVTIESFGNILDYFGPMGADPSLKKDIIRRILATCHHAYFFGEISSKEAELNHLRVCPVGTYLVRLSDSIAGCFTISRNAPEGGIKHHRIYYKPNVGFTINYTTNENEKKTVTSSKPSESLGKFIKTLKEDLNLKYPAPNSKFAAILKKSIFQPNADGGGYGEDNS